MEEEFQEFLDAFHPQPLEFFKRTEAARREKTPSNIRPPNALMSPMMEIMDQHRGKSFIEYFPKDVFSKNCPSGGLKPGKDFFGAGDNWKKSSLPNCLDCQSSATNLNHMTQPCWFLKKEITLHLFVMVSSLYTLGSG